MSLDRITLFDVFFSLKNVKIKKNNTKCMTKMENFAGSRKVAHILKV
jgi:hypothetical protein